ncbi:ribose 1,5-bisphosphokinase [Photobacterium sanctipauli]|uniref:Ribose 1,5-bisphosphate phosphokinase PhnN n=1 Tax=Photobacterium sanctipauli TaxID=1342794 RepID=A0A2T3NN25_9GAMM|nr:ribose 1,5-bisphosphokinase [Photobacterium sanctipauli]PSW16863.1 ribose 1,5-bisphosphokinase [Photobacterium sanctipauli]
MKNKSATLFYLIGASGAGKDSVLHAMREMWPDKLMVAHRYITRAAEAGGENHVALSEKEFLQRQESGLFAMSWQANGYRYGVGAEIDLWLSQGRDVIVNGSRAYLDTAIERYGDNLVPVVIDVEPAVLKQRLYARGRESEREIIKRLDRAELYRRLCPANGIVVDNSGSLENTMMQFSKALSASLSTESSS